MCIMTTVFVFVESLQQHLNWKELGQATYITLILTSPSWSVLVYQGNELSSMLFGCLVVNFI